MISQRGFCCAARLAGVILALQFGATSESVVFDWSSVDEIAPGIRYIHQTPPHPRPLHIHAMLIDARHPRVRFNTTAPHTEWIGNLHETRRTTTRDFMREARAAGLSMIAAINADAFEPWPAPYAKRSLSNLRGLAVSSGELVSPPLEEGASFVVYTDRRVAIERTVQTVNGIDIAVSGFAVVLENNVAIGGDERLAPRTGIGVSGERYVILLVIDGRRHASQGATTIEVGRWLNFFGAEDGVNLDGGGSATMVRHDPTVPGDGVVLLNSPVGDGKNWLNGDAATEREQYQPTERANGNNLGVYLAPE